MCIKVSSSINIDKTKFENNNNNKSEIKFKEAESAKPNNIKTEYTGKQVRSYDIETTSLNFADKKTVQKGNNEPSSELNDLPEIGSGLNTERSSNVESSDSTSGTNQTESNLAQIKAQKDALEANFNTSVNQLISSNTALSVTLNSLPTQDRNSFTMTAATVADTTNIGLTSGNRVATAAASKLSSEVMSATTNGHPEKIVTSMVSYSNFAMIIGDTSKSDEEVRAAGIAYFGEDGFKAIAPFMGGINTSDPNTNTSNTGKSEGTSSELQGTARTLSPWRRQLFLSMGGKFVGGKPVAPFSQKDIETAKKITPQQIKQTFEKHPEIKHAIEKVQNDAKQVIKTQNELGVFMSEHQKELKMIKELETRDKINNEINKSVDEIIARADELQAKFDDTIVFSEDASISTLLEKFRNIITKLDKDTKEAIKHSLEAQFISESFRRYNRDMSIRLESIDKTHKELMKIIEDSKAKKF